MIPKLERGDRPGSSGRRDDRHDGLGAGLLKHMNDMHFDFVADAAARIFRLAHSGDSRDNAGPQSDHNALVHTRSAL